MGQTYGKLMQISVMGESVMKNISDARFVHQNECNVNECNMQ